MVKVLLIEDNQADIDLMLEALTESSVSFNIVVARDGISALKLLSDTTEITPALIILDLNLPYMDGHILLKQLKLNDVLKLIPIVILTTSQAQMDIIKAYKNGANCYVIKPFDFEDFIKIVKTIEEFWFSTVSLPGVNNAECRQ